MSYATLLILISLLIYQKVNCDFHPAPIITIHGGHIGLYDRLLETQFDGVIETGDPYTLDIYMGNTDEYDYVIERCVFNDRLTFIDNGCLRKTAFFIQKWETNQYSRAGAIKRTLVQFFADQPILRFECAIRVIRCVGCAEQSCERRPIINSYKTWNMPLSCCGNYPPPIYPPVVPPLPRHDNEWWFDGWFWGLPWYLWLLFLILLLLLLCCLCGLIGWCLVRGRRKRRTSVYSNRVYTPPPSHSNRVYTVDGASQTVPEFEQVSQQVDMHESYSRYYNHPQKEHAYNLRQVDNHAALDLHPEGRAAYTNYDGDFYEEDLHERAFSKYDTRNNSTPITIPIHHRQSSNHYSGSTQDERRLQRELEEHLRNRHHDRSDEFVERIEEQLSRSHHHNQQRHVEPENFREETVRSMRQSSIL